MTLRDHGVAEALRTIGRGRSPRWPAFARAFRRLHPQCLCCVVRSTTDVQVHHRFPFHYCVALGRPDLELDVRNLITLCEGKQRHHLLIGHLGSFESTNLDVAEDAVTFRGMSLSRIKRDPRWIAKVRSRLTPLEAMTRQEKAALLKRMNATFPRV